MEVEGDDHLGARVDRGGEHVTVMGVGQLELVDLRQVTSHYAVSHSPAHQLAGPLEPGGVEVGPALGDASDHLVEDLFGPLRLDVQTRFSPE